MEEVTVVSGLPRSGTSLMMRMLEAAGIEPLCDEARPADDDNPRGYYELEAVKRTRVDPSWVDAAAGRAVKVIYALLPDLPLAGHRYRVVVMHRALPDVLESQGRMLERLGRAGGRLSDEEMATALGRRLKGAVCWIERQPGFRTLHVEFSRLVGDPAARDAEAERVARFVGRPERAPAMAAMVEPALVRSGGGAP